MSEINVFPRGTKVKFLGFTTQGGVTFRSGTSYIWGYLQFPDALRYVIEHPEGYPKEEFMDPTLGSEGLEYLKNIMDDKKKYILVFENDIEVIPVDQPTSIPAHHHTNPPAHQHTSTPAHQHTGPPDLSNLPD